jgi:uncharacterized protein with FMN-binding domain
MSLRTKIIAGALVILAVLGFGYSRGRAPAMVQEVPVIPTESQANQSVTPSAPAPAEVVSMYQDGIYSQSGAYNSPAGSESVSIRVTLEKDIITAIDFKGGATNKGSIANQNKFAEGFKDQVIGKSINLVSLDVVNGASLTSIGFMDALKKVQATALK